MRIRSIAKWVWSAEAIMGDGDSLIRFAVGIEEPESFFDDFEEAFAGGNGWEFDSRTK